MAQTRKEQTQNGNKAPDARFKRQLAAGIAAVVIIAAAVVLLARREYNGGEYVAGASEPPESRSADLVIPLADISETASFYPVEAEGTKLEVIAVKAPDGTVRTAFNTCRVCYDSGRGYYKQSGDVLVCQNCGNRFPMSRVEVEAGGCNPWPIFSEDKTVTDDAITISYEFLSESKDIFANWKAF
ncbi:MAG: DUF2318 domain-containing protein [Oscillospiraceae bacterium]|jgi:uncharacterized membrane protein|nr:DUF2318 domain-containing protein [Oscillospiraceae bacterium]